MAEKISIDDLWPMQVWLSYKNLLLERVEKIMDYVTLQIHLLIFNTYKNNDQFLNLKEHISSESFKHNNQFSYIDLNYIYYNKTKAKQIFLEQAEASSNEDFRSWKQGIASSANKELTRLILILKVINIHKFSDFKVALLKLTPFVDKKKLLKEFYQIVDNYLLLPRKQENWKKWPDNLRELAQDVLTRQNPRSPWLDLIPLLSAITMLKRVWFNNVECAKIIDISRQASTFKKPDRNDDELFTAILGSHINRISKSK